MYIDPGAGLLALQAAVAALLAIPFLFRRTIARTVRRLQGKPHAEPPTQSAPDRASDPGGEGDA